MNAFVPFTATRKATIQHVKARLVDPKNRPTKDPKYGTKYPALFLKDYAVYAALRGADFRKTSHMEDGANAKAAIQGVIDEISGIAEARRSYVEGEARTKDKDSVVTRFLHEGGTFEDLQDIKAILIQSITG
ncbi:hypothetical protein RYA05_00295 [Pseudomonas syringae pv. actinidiae]|nr:hypothetical protein [Pseudomonas syringae pv. actinidiae]